MAIVRMIATVMAAVTALLVFPNRIPEFAGLWLAYATFLVVRRHAIGWHLLAVPVWLAIKWPEPTLAMLAFAVGTFVTGVIVFRLQKNVDRLASELSEGVDGEQKSSFRRLVPSVMILLWGLWLGWFLHDRAGEHASFSSRSTANRGPVVCLGDSLTDYGYPQMLEQQIDFLVADFGRDGFTVSDAMKLVPEIVALQPAAIVIEIGGHDFKDGSSRQETASKLRSMIENFQASGAKVILVAIPRGFINDPWYGFERQLAREYDLELVPDSMIRRLIYFSPIVPPGAWLPKEQQLSQDGLHPNARGNRMMADMIATCLRKTILAE